MNSNWSRIFKVIEKPERTIIGLMSGTSMDGLDIALCRISGSGPSTRINLLQFMTVAYSGVFRSEIRSVFSRRAVDLQMVCLLNAKIGLAHAAMILDALQQWDLSPDDVDIIASHGQTIFHAPQRLHQLKEFPNATLQIGDADHIAVKTGIITIADFRQKHIAFGGEGAPLALYGDYLLFSKPGQERILLNIGGISNFTYLPGNGGISGVFSTDVGPGNTLMDQYVHQYFDGLRFDRDAEIARSGKISLPLLEQLMSVSFLKEDFPKTTGPELFSLELLDQAMARAGAQTLSREDVMATLCAFSAEAIIIAVRKCARLDQAPVVYLSGGGIHNPMLVGLLKEGIPEALFHTTAELGINPDAKEAILFALLANETLSGDPSLSMGKVSFPK